MSSPEHDLINASVREQLETLVRSYNINMMDHDERLTALEVKSRSSTTAPLAACTPDHNHISRESMKKFIKGSSQKKLAKVLMQLCDRDDNVHKFAACQLLDCEESVRAGNVHHIVPSVSLKRKTREEMSEGAVTCEKCWDGYSLRGRRRPGECRYHPGRKHVDTDSKYWINWDESIDGTPESAVEAVECEEGMYWDCCDETGGESEGCIVTTHQPYHKRVKRNPDV